MLHNLPKQEQTHTPRLIYRSQSVYKPITYSVGNSPSKSNTQLLLHDDMNLLPHKTANVCRRKADGFVVIHVLPSGSRLSNYVGEDLNLFSPSFIYNTLICDINSPLSPPPQHHRKILMIRLHFTVWAY